MAEREDRSQEKLFRTETVPGKAGSGRLFDERPVTQESVECLGMTFESEDARRTYFLDRLKEQLPGLRKRSDFPVGEDDDILRLSDPPGTPPAPTRSWPSSWDTMAVRTWSTDSSDSIARSA